MSEFETSEKKLHLLLSLNGVEIEDYNKEKVSEFYNGIEYKTLFENCKVASNYNTITSRKLVNDFNTLSYEISSYQDLYILEIKTKFLLARSTPEYYMNPTLDNDKYNFPITTLGDLKLMFRNEFVSYNDLKHIRATKDEKLDAITDACVRYHQEAVEKTSKQLNKLIESNNLKQYFTLDTLSSFLRYLVLFFILGYTLILSCVGNKEIIKNFYHPAISSIYTYIIYIPLIGSLLSLITFISFYIVKKRIQVEFSFNRKFIKTRKSTIFKDITKNNIQLKKYLSKCVLSFDKFKDDINLFSDPYKYLKVEESIKIRRKMNKSVLYNTMLIISNLVLILSLLAVIFSLISIVILGVF